MSTTSEHALPVRFRGGILRRLQAGDLAAFQAYRSLPELGRYQGWSPMREPEALAFLDEMRTAPLFVPGEWIQLGIAEPASGRLVGDIGICVSTDGSEAEIGFTLEPAAQGRGIATAAVRAAAALLFDATPVRQVLGITDARNEASVRLLERAGFRCIESRSATFRGEACTEQIHALARGDRERVASGEALSPRRRQ